MTIQGVVFDLDDTLYDQQVYLQGAFGAVAAYLSGRFHVDEISILERLLEISKEKGSDSGKIIDDCIVSAGGNASDDELIGRAVDAFLSFTPKELLPYRESREVLEWLKQRRVRLGLLTDGRPQVQRAKISALSIAGYFNAIVLSDECGRNRRKPDALPYRNVLRSLGIGPDECVFVGDNPRKDFIGARKLGIRTVRVLTGEYRNLSLGGEFDADDVIESLAELPMLLEGIERASH
ncbi:MAG TPA: HAD-IA family hydrolase [Nitrososphaerales archaeon]|nr:HAD-IA family hydrolase [Nitrososphaerales archaeon]